jgi:hypothetical protein
MERVVDKVRQIVARYEPHKSDEQIKVVRALMAAVSDCKRYVAENSSTDRGCAQRIVRDLYDVLATLPTFSHLMAKKSEVHKLHTRKLAEDELESIYEHLRSLVNEHEHDRQERIHAWVEQHPVFGELKRVLSKPLPKNAYVLLFRGSAGDGAELITNEAPDGRVFTRFRPQVFKDDLHTHKLYKDEQAVVGAALIANQELIAVIGNVPQPEESTSQLKMLLSLSRQEVERPARDYMEANTILHRLHQMWCRRELPKESYVLLFEEVTNTPVSCTDDAADPEIPDAAADQHSVSEANTETPGGGPEALPEDPAQSVSEVEAPMSSTPPSPTKIATKTGENGRVISRFWPSDFSEQHRLFEAFKNRPAILGAAVIKDNQLLNVLGHVPAGHGKQSQLDALLDASWMAVEKPYVDFIEQHEVLRHLHQLATGEMASKPVDAVLFTVAANGRLEVMPIDIGSGKHQSRVSLEFFLRPKQVHDRVGNHQVVGASVISREPDSHRHQRFRQGSDDGKRQARRLDQDQLSAKPSVLAAFGRTPLKVNMLATSDTLRRLGIELDEPSRDRRPNRRFK